jgi:CysZ protein
MINAAFKALADLISKDFRSILWASIGLAIGLFLLIFAGVEALFWAFTFVRWPWLETIMAVGAGFGLLVAFFFLMAPVTSVFAGFYLDRIAAMVEQRHYPNDRPGQPLSGWTAIATSLQFAGLVLIANLFALPLIFTGIGIFVLFAVNAYLISREYFEMAAMRHMPPAAARALRKANAMRVFVAGCLPAALAIVPVVNLVVPLFATSYFVHILKRVMKS